MLTKKTHDKSCDYTFLEQYFIYYTLPFYSATESPVLLAVKGAVSRSVVQLLRYRPSLRVDQMGRLSLARGENRRIALTCSQLVWSLAVVIKRTHEPLLRENSERDRSTCDYAEPNHLPRILLSCRSVLSGSMQLELVIEARCLQVNVATLFSSFSYDYLPLLIKTTCFQGCKLFVEMSQGTTSTRSSNYIAH